MWPFFSKPKSTSSTPRLFFYDTLTGDEELFVPVRPGEATMYSCVRRLEADGDIEWYWGDETQGGRRKYFRITEKGHEAYTRNKSNWEYARRVLENLL